MRKLTAASIVVLAACTAKTPALDMRFIDNNDSSPVANAAVTYCATAWGGTMTGHGGPSGTLFKFETSTNSRGELKLAPQEYEPRPFGMSTNYDFSKLLIVKEGYEPHQVRNWGAAFGEYAAASTWAYNGMTIRLKRSGSGKAAAINPNECGEGWAAPIDPRTVAPPTPGVPPAVRAPQEIEQHRRAAQPAQTR